VDQRRLLLAFAVSLLFLMLYQEWIVRTYPRPQQESSAPPQAESPIGPTASATSGAGAGSGLVAPSGDAPLITVETDLLRAEITPIGARLAQVTLKHYPRTVDAGSDALNLVDDGPILPLTLQIAGGKSDAGVGYRAQGGPLILHGDDRGEVVFSGELDGLQIEKRYTFSGASYLFGLSTRVSGGRDGSPVGLVLTPMPPDGVNGRTREAGVALVARKLLQKPLKDMEKQDTTIEDADWAGFAAQYFLLAAVPAPGTSRALMGAVDGLPVVRLDVSSGPQGSAVLIYAGPKDQADLAQAGHDLGRALDFGWFWFIAIPLLQGLRLLHSVTGNYGVAIIVLTALVKAATAPLTQTTFRNMREMQKIQPQMSKLRERFKDDQVTLQKEVMELYRRHRVNPLSGCLPMLLQLPIFVGLYNALGHAIELRHAPFALWINDLSAPDHLMIAGIGIPVLTILMGASMFLQQWISPQQGDPAQQRMMMLMPVMMTVMFVVGGFPAGLVLYWLVNNLLSIAQQYWMMRTAT
jgi:YidC/Oxa1 family membrane protein insertase